MNTKIIDELQLRTVIVGNLRSAINDSGPITKQLIDHAAKRIYNGLAGHLEDMRRQDFINKLDDKVKAEWEGAIADKQLIINDLRKQRDDLLEKLNLKK